MVGGFCDNCGAGFSISGIVGVGLMGLIGLMLGLMILGCWFGLLLVLTLNNCYG